MMQDRLPRFMRMKSRVHRALSNSACVCMVACLSACGHKDTPATAAAASSTTSPAGIPPSSLLHTVATTMQTTANGGGAPSNVQKMVVLDFQCVDMTNVLVWLAELTGDTIIADPGVRGPVTIANPQPTSPEQAQQIVFSVLESKGFSAVRQMVPGGQGSIIKIIPKIDAARTPIPATRSPLQPDDTSTKER